MNKINKHLSFFLILLFLLFTSLTLTFAEETVTITTYYPSPYGVYNSLQVDKLGVGDNSGDDILNSADVPTTSGDAWIKGKLGIGTAAAGPDKKLVVDVGGATHEDAVVKIKGSYNPSLDIYSETNWHPRMRLITNNGTDKWETSAAGSWANKGLVFSYNSSDKVVISSTGAVGIGTASPATELHLADVNASGDTEIRIEGSGNVWELSVPAAIYGRTFSINDLTANKTRLVIDGNGNVGLGTASPSAKLTFADNYEGSSVATGGIAWYGWDPTVYGIYRTPGAWSAPDYQQLKLAWDTGIIIDGGMSYGKSGTLLQPSGGNVGIGTPIPGYKLDVQGGDINTSGVYRAGGTAGVTAYSAMVGNLTVVGGIVTGLSAAEVQPETPYIFVWDGKGYQPVSDFLFGEPKTHFATYNEGIAAYQKASVGSDFYALPISPLLNNNAYDIEIRELELENTYLDFFALHKIGHPAGTTIVTDNVFNNFYCLPDSELSDLILPEGIVSENPENPTPASSVFVTLPDRGAGKMLLESNLRSSGEPRVIEVYYQDKTGAWVKLTDIRSRRPNKTAYIIDLPQPLTGQFTLKFSSWEALVVQRIGVLKKFTPQAYHGVVLKSAEPARNILTNEIVGERIAAKDNVFLRLITDDVIRLKHLDSPVTGEKVTFLISASGFYVSNKDNDSRISELLARTSYLEDLVKQLQSKINIDNKASE